MSEVSVKLVVALKVDWAHFHLVAHVHDEKEEANDHDEEAEDMYSDFRFRLEHGSFVCNEGWGVTIGAALVQNSLLLLVKLDGLGVIIVLLLTQLCILAAASILVEECALCAYESPVFLVVVRTRISFGVLLEVHRAVLILCWWSYRF